MFVIAWMNPKGMTLSEKTFSKGYIMYVSIYMSFSERQNCGDEEQTRSHQGLEGQRGCDYKKRMRKFWVMDCCVLGSGYMNIWKC